MRSLRLLTRVRTVTALVLLSLLATSTVSAHSDDMAPAAGGLPGWLVPYAGTLETLHVSAHVLIGLFSLGIVGTLAYTYGKSRRHLSYHRLFLPFGLFIAAAGVYNFTHAGLELGMPIVLLSGSVQAVVLLAAGLTLLTLPRLVPRLLATLGAAGVAQQRLAALEAAQAEVRALRAQLERQEQPASRARPQAVEVVRLAPPLSIAFRQALRSQGREVVQQPAAHAAHSHPPSRLMRQAGL